MRKIIPGVLLALLAIAAAPAYAQSNTELINDIYDSTLRISSTISQIVPTLNDLIDEVRIALDGMSGIVASVDENKVTLQENAQALKNIESALLGQVCGEGTYPIGGICVAEIVGCDAEVNMAGICEAKISCGEGTIQHLDTCIADISISYCGEGTIFEGGVCVADMGHTPKPGPTQTRPIAPVVTDRHIIDGDTIQIDTNDDGVLDTYDLAFVAVPGLSEPGGRAAISYLLDICGDAPITVIPDTQPKTSPPRGLVQCNTYDVAQTMINAGHGTFDAEDCNIRAFVGINEAVWHDDQCRIAEAARLLQVPPATTPAPPMTTPTPPAEPMEPEEPTPIQGTLGYREFSFPVTVGDILAWPMDANDDAYATATISCLFEHTPTELDIVLNEADNGVYNVNTSPDYANEERDHDTLIALISPINVDMVNQKFQPTSAPVYHVFDKPVPGSELVKLSGNDADYDISVELADWNNTLTLADRSMPTAAEKAAKVFDVDFTILTDITNNDCSFTMSGSHPSGDVRLQTELLGITVDARSVGYDVRPIDVTCSEAVTITKFEAATSNTFIDTFDKISIYDNSEGTIITTEFGAPAKTGNLMTTSDFTVGYENFLASQTEITNAGVVSIEYLATSPNACIWTERAQ